MKNSKPVRINPCCICHSFKFILDWFKQTQSGGGPGEVTQWLRALAEDLALLPSTLLVAPSVTPASVPSSGLLRYRMHLVHRQAKHRNLKLNKI